MKKLLLAIITGVFFSLIPAVGAAALPGGSNHSPNDSNKSYSHKSEPAQNYSGQKKSDSHTDNKEPKKEVKKENVEYKKDSDNGYIKPSYKPTASQNYSNKNNGDYEKKNSQPIKKSSDETGKQKHDTKKDGEGKPVDKRTPKHKDQENDDYESAKKNHKKPDDRKEGSHYKKTNEDSKPSYKKDDDCDKRINYEHDKNRNYMVSKRKDNNDCDKHKSYPPHRTTYQNYDYKWYQKYCDWYHKYSWKDYEKYCKDYKPHNNPKYIHHSIKHKDDACDKKLVSYHPVHKIMKHNLYVSSTCKKTSHFSSYLKSTRENCPKQSCSKKIAHKLCLCNCRQQCSYRQA